MTIELFIHPFSSYCQKAITAFYENDIPFAARELEPGGGPNQDELRRLWPIGKFPLLREGDRVVPEATSIIEYLHVHHPGPVRLIPDDPDAAIEVRLLDRFFDNYVAAPQQKLIFDRIRPEEQRNPADVADYLVGETSFLKNSGHRSKLSAIRYMDRTDEPGAWSTT